MILSLFFVIETFCIFNILQSVFKNKSKLKLENIIIVFGYNLQYFLINTYCKKRHNQLKQFEPYMSLL